MIKLLFLMTGGALGTLARYAASGLAHRMTETLFPVGTLVVNSAGSLLIGIAVLNILANNILGIIFVFAGFFATHFLINAMK